MKLDGNLYLKKKVEKIKKKNSEQKPSEIL